MAARDHTRLGLLAFSQRRHPRGFVPALVSPELPVQSRWLRRRRYWIAWAATGGPIAEADFYDDMVAKCTARNPAFSECWTRREQQNQPQTAVDAGHVAVVRLGLESMAGDATVSTVERYAGSLGYVVRYHLAGPERQR